MKSELEIAYPRLYTLLYDTASAFTSIMIASVDSNCFKKEDWQSWRGNFRYFISKIKPRAHLLLVLPIKDLIRYTLFYSKHKDSYGTISIGSIFGINFLAALIAGVIPSINLNRRYDSN